MSSVDWHGQIDDPVINARWRQTIIDTSLGGGTNIYSLSSLPPRTVGVCKGKLFMSSDLGDEARREVPTIRPENN